ncbi:copper amine oxidase N-terminal domain-containing protein [Fontibacillus sp. BL9]|uniref:copper amine oxidase N-terminal domain-containing protein n=1 Tax=Fontibacillus sp. BL9 TaxID=3389971 RepID=UPI00397E2924
MKKVLSMLTAILVLATILPASSFGAAVQMPLRVEVDGERIYFPDAQPFADKNQRVQVPVRFVSEALGADVDWKSATKTVTVVLNSDSIILTLDKKAYTVNGQKKQMDTAALRKESRTFVPLRFVSEGLGATVEWDAAINTVLITTDNGNSSNTSEEGTDPKSSTADPDAPENPTKPTDPANPENPTNPTNPGGTSSGEDEIQEDVIHGFKVYYNTGSQLRIDEPSAGKNAKLESGSFVLGLRITFLAVGNDYGKQVEEMEAVLRQQVDSKTVDGIMAYVKKKKVSEDILESKVFKDDTYEFWVGSQENADVSVKIYLR